MTEDSLPTLWEAGPHTTAKLSILKAYLQAWMPILSRRVASKPHGHEVVYIDAFAGPGEDRKGKPGSPLVAIDAAREHEQEFPIPIRMFFIEKREDRWKHLKELIDTQVGRPTRNAVVEDPICGSADEQVRSLLLARKDFCPMLVFLDQFGYSLVSMELIKTIMASPSREVFSFMNWRDLNRYLPDQTKWSGIDKALGGQEWRQVMNLSKNEKSQLFLDIYSEALKAKANVRYSCSFSMHDENDQLLYWLIFCSNNDRGLEEMKKSMWSVDARGQFRFSDRHSGQLRMLPGFDQKWLAEKLRVSLENREMKVDEIRHYVLTETPCYLYNGALASLEKTGDLGVVAAPPGRKEGTFAKYVDDPEFIVRFQRVASQIFLFK
jgi:three-Cys-motif partner protein